MPRRSRPIILGIALLAGALGVDAAPGPQDFGGNYEDLSAEQKALVVDLFARFAEATGEEIEPEEGYERTRMSVRATFEAVTHALQNTELTDEEGRSLGTGLDLILHVETVAGRVPDAGTDRQFRMYARLIPEARDLLERSQQFSKGPSNFMFHPGYPKSYRQGGGSPSIQISVSEDFQRADIDVDYRSLIFPISLFDGHLTAANSDVRAGDNAERHQGRWEGFVDWWRGLFGLSSAPVAPEEEADLTPLATVPRSEEDRIDRAVGDFLTAWLVEGRPEVAVGYLSRRAYECLALQPGEAEPFDYGMAPYRIWRALRRVNEILGPVDSLEGVSVGVRWVYPGLVRLEHDAHPQYVIFGVPDGLADAWTCENLARPGRPMPRVNRGRDVTFDSYDYFLSTFYVDDLPGQSGSLALLWGREGDYWKVISYEADPEPAGTGDLPDMRDDEEAPSPEFGAGDPEMLATMDEFFAHWLVDKDVDAAMDFVSPALLSCVDLYQDPDETPVQTAAEREERLRLGLQRTAEGLGDVGRLEEAISGITIWNPVVRAVAHDNAGAFSVYNLPEWVGVDAQCERRRAGDAPLPEEERPQGYGRYYLSAFRVNTHRGETVAAALAWVNEGNGWRIFSLKIADP